MDTRDDVADLLDKCDAAVAEKPLLSTVFDRNWRRQFRQCAESSASHCRGWPSTYLLPALGGLLPHDPADLQQRVEDGLALLWDKMSDRQRRDMTVRVRGAGSTSAEEELLAAYGFAQAFGRDAVFVPDVRPDESRPEFIVCCDDVQFGVECRGLFDRQEIRELKIAALASGENSWFRYTETDDQPDARRFQNALLKKLRQHEGRIPIVLILTYYTPWLPPAEARGTVERVLAAPNEFDVPRADLPLAVALVTGRAVRGTWLSEEAITHAGLPGSTGQQIKGAVSEAFPDEVLGSGVTGDDE